MATYLTIDDGLKRALGYLDDADTATVARMETTLASAEHYVQGAVGQSDTFWTSEGVKNLYMLACNAVAVTWFNAAGDAGDLTTANMIIGQLRGRFSEAEENETTQGK